MLTLRSISGLPCTGPDELGARIARVILVIGFVVDIGAFVLGLGVKGVFKHANVGHVLACFTAVFAGMLPFCCCPMRMVLRMGKRRCTWTSAERLMLYMTVPLRSVWFRAYPRTPL